MRQTEYWGGALSFSRPDVRVISQPTIDGALGAEFGARLSAVVTWAAQRDATAPCPDDELRPLLSLRANSLRGPAISLDKCYRPRAVEVKGKLVEDPKTALLIAVAEWAWNSARSWDNPPPEMALSTEYEDILASRQKSWPAEVETDTGWVWVSRGRCYSVGSREVTFSRALTSEEMAEARTMMEIEDIGSWVIVDDRTIRGGHSIDSSD